MSRSDGGRGEDVSGEELEGLGGDVVGLEPALGLIPAVHAGERVNR
jgi:hypothetical protein